jgi:hypothetical protein
VQLRGVDTLACPTVNLSQLLIQITENLPGVSVSLTLIELLKKYGGFLQSRRIYLKHYKPITI